MAKEVAINISSSVAGVGPLDAAAVVADEEVEDNTAADEGRDRSFNRKSRQTA